MRFRILGPLEVWTGTEWVSLNAPKWRIVLATLLLHPREVVSAARLVDELWPGEPPGGARKLVSLYVMRVRRVLGDCDASVLVTRPPGYQLLVDFDDVDARWFDDLTHRGRQALADRRAPHAAALLADALALWRGPVLGDVPRAPLVVAAADQLEESRLEAIELRCEADLACGRHHELIPELRRLVTEYPLRECFRSQLMLALYRCGRQSEALASYRQARRILVDQFGLDPGPRLTRLHKQILRSDPALLPADPIPPRYPPPPARRPDEAPPRRPGEAPSEAPTRRPGEAPSEAPSEARPEAPPRRPDEAPCPRQLPSATPRFVGRTAELATLSALSAMLGTEAPTIAVISGTAGVGKTALAVHWAHQMADEFPDGQLYLDLHGFGPWGSPMTTAEAISGLLETLFVPAGRIPNAPWAQAALYRSLLAGKRMLVVLDNARDSGQVRPLLPGSAGAACMVVVTSRCQLTGLIAADGACPLPLDLLTTAEARALLARHLGPQRCASEPAAVAELIQLSGRLPLALSSASAQAAWQPHLSLAVLTERLRDPRRRLDALSAGDEAITLREALSWFYEQQERTRSPAG